MLGKVAGVVLPDPARAVALDRAVGWVAVTVLTAWLWWRARVGGAAAIRAPAGALLAAVVLIPVIRAATVPALTLSGLTQSSPAMPAG